MREREIKLLVEAGRQLPPVTELLRGIGDGSVEQVDQDAVYFDTADLRLTRAGASLRYRSDDGWTVKLPGAVDGATYTRGEYGFEGTPGSPPPAAVEFVRAWARGDPLAEVARLRTHRRRIRVHDTSGRPIGEIDDDSVSASTPDRRPLGRFHEVELELDEAADRRAVNRLLRRLQRCSRRGDALPKIVRALGEPAQAPADLVVPPKPGPKATTDELVRYVLAASVEELLDHDPLVRIGEDPEAVHRARVGTRRLRSHLRTFRPVLDRAWADGLRDELRWIGDLLGHVRDDDVLLELLQSRAKALPERHTQAFEPLRERLEAQRRRHRDALLDAMRSRRYSALLDALVDAARGPHMSVGWTGRRATRAAAKVTRRPWARVRKQMKSLSDPPTDAELHEVRKRAKQVRYAYEAVAPVAGKRAKRTAKAVARVQSVLGSHHDAVVASAWLEDAAAGDQNRFPVFTAGLLAGEMQAEQRQLRAEWPRVWRRARRRHRRS